MATQMVTPTIRKRAEEMAARIPFLSRGRSKVNGAGFYLVPGSTAGTVYYSNALGCTCPGYRHRGVCAHQQACLLAEQRAAAARYEAAAPIREANRRAASERIQARRKGYADLFPIDDDNLEAF